MAKPSEDQGTLVLPSQLRKARGLLKLTPEEVAEGLHVGVRDVARWETGELEPSLRQLEDLAELYGRELDYFLGETPEPPENIRFRTAPDQALTHLSKQARVVLARFEELCRCAYELEGLLGRGTTCNVPRLSSSISPESAAAEVRDLLGVGHKPVPKLRDVLEQAGARIFELPVPNNEFSGFSFWHPDYGPCTLVNASEQRGRRNFTLAHELAHLVYRHASSVCSIPQSLGGPSPLIEQKANIFAVEFLLPARALRADFSRKGYSGEPSGDELRPLRYKWGVSLQALGYRLERLGLIRKGHTDRLVEAEVPFFRGPKTPSWERQLGKRFVNTCLEAYRENLVSIGKLAHSLDIPIRKAAEEVERRAT